MLGIIRFVFSICVVITHLTGAASLSNWGAFAVFGFYVLSGYLITNILNEVYYFQLSSFVANRFLRLFPIYYFVATFSAVIIFMMPNAGNFHAAWTLDLGGVNLLGHVLIFPFGLQDATVQEGSFRLVPTIWSVGVELVNYFLLWLVIARSRNLAVACLMISAAYHVISLYMGMPLPNRYFPFYAALLPFSIGANLYFLRGYFSAISFSKIRLAAWGSFIVWGGNLLLCSSLGGLGGKYIDIFFYVNLAALTVFIGCIVNSTLQLRFKESGVHLGDIAYPVFLTHWIVGFMLSALVTGDQKRGLMLFVLSVIPIIGVSFLLSRVTNYCFQPMRDRIRSRARDYKLH